MFGTLRAVIVGGLLGGGGIVGYGLDVATVPVGNVGNVAENAGLSFGGYGADRACGAVGYAYRMGTFEVTAGEYATFLNAVAADDVYGLYDARMWSDAYGCRIARAGVAGGYHYAVASDWADRPVNFVSWGDAARFANWLYNGQPVGGASAATTEDGSYRLLGATGDAALLAVQRTPNATWVIPTEDEWYKAAYHKNDGATGDYWDYPTRADSPPSPLLLAPDPGNTATFFDGAYTIGAPYFRTAVGAHTHSAGPYGTFDQGGNVWEWTEAVFYDAFRGVRGGGFNPDGFPAADALRAANRDTYDFPASGSGIVGFRVALIPEPATVWLAAAVFLIATRPARRCRRWCAVGQAGRRTMGR